MAQLDEIATMLRNRAIAICMDPPDAAFAEYYRAYADGMIAAADIVEGWSYDNDVASGQKEKE